MVKFDVASHFKDFETSLRTSDEHVQSINKRVKKITKAINTSYWDNESDTQHSMLVGSYGRGTAIDISDVDLLVELPASQKERFSNYLSNGQSALLNDIKAKLKQEYPTSNIKADGQIVSIKFSDGIGFEILPAFPLYDGYEYPDTNNGGRWKTTNPELDQKNLKLRNKEFDGSLKRFARMLRAWKDKNNVSLSGIAIDALVYNFFSTWKNDQTSYSYFDWLSRDFFEWLYHFIDSRQKLISLDTFFEIELDLEVGSKSKTAWKRSLKAIENQMEESVAEEEWTKIYGSHFPVHAPKTDNAVRNVVAKQTISSKETRAFIGNAIDTEEFYQDKGWKLSQSLKYIDIHVQFEGKGFRRASMNKPSKIPIGLITKLYFNVQHVSGVTWYWKVRNVGDQANSRNQIRGQIKLGSENNVEPTSFKGNHYVEVYGVQGTTITHFGKRDVPLENSEV